MPAAGATAQVATGSSGGSSSSADSIPVPRAVAVGGVQILVLVDGEVVSSHSQLHTAVSRLVRELIECPGCDVSIEQTQRYRGEVDWLVREVTEPEPGPEPEPDPEPDPNAVDSISVYPTTEPAWAAPDAFMAADLYWVAGRSRLCVTVADEPGLIDVLLQELPEYTYDWLVAFAGGQFLPQSCEPVQATLAAIPTEDQPTLAVGVIPEAVTLPPVIGAPSRPEFEALSGSSVRAYWPPADNALRYRVEWGDGSAETAETELVIDGYTGWVCVYALHGEYEAPTWACNSWAGGADP